MRLSVIIPMYNEEKTLHQIFTKVRQAPIEKEIIIVDDGSTDGTRTLLKKYEQTDNVKVIYQDKNYGKGAAIRAAISLVAGDITIIQDADLEYDPEDYLKLIEPFRAGVVKVVYGSRFLNKQNRHSYRRFYLGGVFLSLLTNLLYFQRLTDESTCYKVFDSRLLKSINLKCKGFEFCPEVTAKVAKRGILIKEIPISYYPRSIQEGKKISWRDGLKAIWILLKYRIID
ncbi:MAG: glycosyltransferase family 2 protein [Candidatus Marinimicrobia bacterium]|nr:glycosyltransferase family 2 protein [Candidatus Neomarinimicrobiota bacterium]MCK9484816.1 glycosyltransferase family 2 protein [Candidatus Neomarinimicrobiota bacterium]MCK9560247.1 glycosyltransferase family 2 protein [Candidatus Neomarinimicrobiota bacterium]